MEVGEEGVGVFIAFYLVWTGLVGLPVGATT